MRLGVAAFGFASLLGTGQAAVACDMEGFGFARADPFARYAASNVPPVEQEKPRVQSVPTEQVASAVQQTSARPVAPATHTQAAAATSD